ncbi:metal ABC transporter solute-binding protein, Zn/Mn family [Paramaledivibacter caminithermalis]|uniref:Zinc transport system substrate-binding protein n=1 Tax=Paramaledivibacter caminithermalis (strain DSM 15212 / CIP 107654 / DViRD3) TaxID=1121301 RepID=A0A1M6PM99_PARC5|nr:zinc ABC transporter substrate-binding protein [Paramaledivibacter caminithermalis]SHK09074.1 zinc transport system substrate-binding protein [Paramaledivibacter caminithermalis DSM 15212]
MDFKRGFMYIVIMIMIVNIIGCEAKESENTEIDTIKNQIIVAVSIVPQETFVKEVAGDLVDVVTMIPPGYSPANYQPTPMQMTKLSKAKVYFSIGVPTENINILPKIDDFNKDIKVVPLADIVGKVYPHRYFEDVEGNEHYHEYEKKHDHSGRDPHIWLSPKRVKVMIDAIKNELINIDPENAKVYTENAAAYLDKLDQVDNDIKEVLSELDGQSFIIYHPSFGYFADDYGLKMVTIEEEGKEATTRRLQDVIDFAKQEKIKFIFYQEEFDSQQAETIAKEIEGATIKVAPLAPNYIENLRYIASKFKEVI